MTCKPGKRHQERRASKSPGAKPGLSSRIVPTEGSRASRAVSGYKPKPAKPARPAVVPMSRAEFEALKAKHPDGGTNVAAQSEPDPDSARFSELLLSVSASIRATSQMEMYVRTDNPAHLRKAFLIFREHGLSVPEFVLQEVASSIGRAKASKRGDKAVSEIERQHAFFKMARTVFGFWDKHPERKRPSNEAVFKDVLARVNKRFPKLRPLQSRSARQLYANWLKGTR